MSAQQLITDHIDLWTGAVTSKSTSGRGSNSKIELTGIKKLRELILELAVRGKLVSQNSEDEPALALFKRISEEAARLSKHSAVKTMPEVDDEEAPYGLPRGWIWTRLASISQINPRNKADDSLAASFIPMPLITTSYRGEHGQEVRCWDEIKKGYTHFSDGDIGLAKITPCFENSKAAVFRNLKNGIGAGSTELHVARPHGKELLSPEFILLHLKAPRFLKEGEQNMTGTAGQKRVPKDFFAGAPLALPPLKEQHRIVQKVDELMALCDRLEQQTSDQLAAHETLVDTLLDTLTQSQNATELADNWARLAAHFDTLFTTEQSIEKLKQTILQLAVMGRLVHQDLRDESASDFLRRIAELNQTPTTGRRQGTRKKMSDVSQDEAPFILPNGWTFVRLGMVADFENGDRSSRYPNASDLVREGIPFFGAKEMVGGDLQFTDELRFITPEKFDSLSNGKLQHNDYVILLRGAVGKLARFRASGKHSTGFINAQMLIIRLPTPGLADYFQIVASSRLFGKAIDEKITGSAVQQMPASVLPEIIIPIPPPAEQRRIAQKVDELTALCDKLKECLHQTGKTRRKLAETVVERAIS